MVFRYDRAFGVESPPSSYEWLLLDAITGDQALFARSDWIHEAWSLVDPWIERSEAERAIDLYPTGSWGPAAAEALLEEAGRRWRLV